MLPSVRPLTSSPKKRLQSTEGKRSHKRVRPTEWWAARVELSTNDLRDPDEDSVLGLVHAERALDHVAVAVELQRQTEQRGLDRDVRLLQLCADLGPRGLAVLARPVDRPRDDLRRHVAGSAEELGALVGLLEGLHPRIPWVHREERVVHV